MNIRTIAILRSTKTKHLNRMDQMNKAVQDRESDFTPAEQTEWDELKTELTEINSVLERGESSEAAYQQRGGGAVGGQDAMAKIESLAREIQTRTGCTKEAATSQTVISNPKLYDAYLAAHPAQTGIRR